MDSTRIPHNAFAIRNINQRKHIIKPIYDQMLINPSFLLTSIKNSILTITRAFVNHQWYSFCSTSPNWTNYSYLHRIESSWLKNYVTTTTKICCLRAAVFKINCRLDMIEDMYNRPSFKWKKSNFSRASNIFDFKKQQAPPTDTINIASVVQHWYNWSCINLNSIINFIYKNETIIIWFPWSLTSSKSIISFWVCSLNHFFTKINIKVLLIKETEE
jgi:hypothetical protein